MSKYYNSMAQPDGEFAWARHDTSSNEVLYAEWLQHRELALRLQEAVPVVKPAYRSPPPCFGEDDYEAVFNSGGFLRPR